MTAPTTDTPPDNIFVVTETNKNQEEKNKENGLSINKCNKWPNCDDSQPKKRGTTYLEGLVHMFRGTVGTGILALPSAFNQSGYVGGILGVIAITYLANYCAVILGKSQQELVRRKKSEIPTYQATVDAAFKFGPKKTRHLAKIFTRTTNFLLIFGQISGNCAYVIFIATNLKEVFDSYVGERSLREYIAWSAPFILLANLVISLKRMALVSGFGNIVLLSSISVIFYYVTQDIPPIEQRQMFGQASDIPYFIGTIFFASGCITLVLPLQNDLNNPEQMSSRFGVLNITASVTGVLYVIFGLLGYLKYGELAQEATVTVNLPRSSIAAKMVQIFLSISTMTATSLQNYITVNILWEDYLRDMITTNVTAVQYILRIVTVILTVIGALVVPNLKLVISVLGIIGQCTLVSTLPVIIHMLTYYQQKSKLKFIQKFYKDFIVLTFNLFILLFQLYIAIINLIN